MREQKFPHRLEDLMFNFEQYLNIFNNQIPFKKHGQFEFHYKTIEMRKKIAGVLNAVNNPDFTKLLWNVLRAWGIGIRGSHLVNYPEFEASLQNNLSGYIDLDSLRINDSFNTEEKMTRRIYSLMENLSIVTNKAKLVPSSKALHHIFPNLIVPIDNAYTKVFFMFDNQEFQYSQYRVFKEAYKVFMRIARSCKPEQYVGSGWNTSQTKVIDNAIIGYCLSNKVH